MQNKPAVQDQKRPSVRAVLAAYASNFLFICLLLTILASKRSYIEDFRSQHYQYENHREIFMAAPSSATDTGIISLRDLIDFVAHVAHCYPEITKEFPSELMQMLSQHHTVLEPDLREKIVTSLVMMRKKEIIDSATYGFTGMLALFCDDMLTDYIVCSRLSSRFWSPLRANRCVPSYTTRSSPTCVRRIRKRRTTSSTERSKPSYSTWSRLIEHLPKPCGL